MKEEARCPDFQRACPPFPETLSCEGRNSQARCSGMGGSAASSVGLNPEHLAQLQVILDTGRLHKVDPKPPGNRLMPRGPPQIIQDTS